MTEKNSHPEKYIKIEYVPTSVVKHRFFSGRIVACHATDSGSISGRCNLLSAHEKCANHYQRIAEKNAHAEENAHSGEKYMIIVSLPILSSIGFSVVRIVACHAIDPGSIPGQCNLLSAHEKCANHYQRNAEKNAHAEENAHSGEKYMIIVSLPILSSIGFSVVRIVACHAIDPGSIPGQCNLLSAHEKCANHYQRIAEKNAPQRKMRTQRKIYDYRVCPYQFCQASVVQW